MTCLSIIASMVSSQFDFMAVKSSVSTKDGEHEDEDEDEDEDEHECVVISSRSNSFTPAPTFLFMQAQSNAFRRVFNFVDFDCVRRRTTWTGTSSFFTIDSSKVDIDADADDTICFLFVPFLPLLSLPLSLFLSFWRLIISVDTFSHSIGFALRSLSIVVYVL